MLQLTGTALKALSPQSSSATAPASAAEPMSLASDPEAQTAAFKEAMDAFLLTLHSVDVRLKRQIMGLEEAGIVSLKDNREAVSLEPNGVGAVGNLDVGWLNSRSNKVERDMEAELWTKARTHLDALVGKDGSEAADLVMEG